MIELLSQIKDQLFDAPSEVKESFNKVVEYFAEGKSTTKSWSVYLIKSRPHGKMSRKHVIVDAKVHKDENSVSKAIESRYPEYKIDKISQSSTSPSTFKSGSIVEDR